MQRVVIKTKIGSNLKSDEILRKIIFELIEGLQQN